MAEWRIGRGWSDEELEHRLERLQAVQRNFEEPLDRMNRANGWHEYFSEAVIARERSGSVEEHGPFARARLGLVNYQFSDPAIVIGHFNPDMPLLGRLMLLEMRAFRVLHFLSGVVVGAVRSEVKEDQTVFGFRYDTLEGHIEKGIEWLLLTKDHDTGEIHFRIEAAWRPGEFPNWWSRIGFSLFGTSYQEKWHRRAHMLLARLARHPGSSTRRPPEGKLAHSHPDITFRRYEAHHV